MTRVQASTSELPLPASGADAGTRPRAPITRRRFLQTVGGAAAATGAAAAFAACSQPEAPNLALDRRIKVGYVGPLTGAQTASGEADNYNLNMLREVLKNGLVAGGTRYGVDIVVKDSQSNEDRATQVANDLIDYDKVQMMTAMSDSSSTVIPTATVCEQRGVPCLSSVTSWNSYVGARDHAPNQPFQWTFHYYWGFEQAVSVFMDIWSQVRTNRTVVALWPDDKTGNEAADPKTGYPMYLRKAGYKLVDLGRYENQNNSRSPDFAPLITKTAAAKADIMTGNPLAVDFIEIWRQMADRKITPPYVTLSRAVNHARQVEALSPSADGITSGLAWHSSFPFKSSLTGATSKEYADRYIEATGRQPTFNLGYGHSLWEVLIDVLKRAGGGDRQALADAIGKTKLDTIVGRVDFTSPNNPSRSIAVMPLVGSQWRTSDGEGFRFDQVIISNKLLPEVPITGELVPIRLRG
ncbi:MAG TPA: ABC transporter substrate-binding protein [Actinomycetes bacterium]|nr:ABC transporter substrate-binding protein [Actinomycetes bacterium]